LVVGREGFGWQYIAQFCQGISCLARIIYRKGQFLNIAKLDMNGWQATRGPKGSEEASKNVQAERSIDFAAVLRYNIGKSAFIRVHILQFGPSRLINEFG